MPCHLPVCPHTSAKLPESSERLSLAPYSVVATHAALLVPLLINYLHGAQNLALENVDLVRKSSIYVYPATRRSRHLGPTLSPECWKVLGTWQSLLNDARIEGPAIALKEVAGSGEGEGDKWLGGQNTDHSGEGSVFQVKLRGEDWGHFRG